MDHPKSKSKEHCDVRTFDHTSNKCDIGDQYSKIDEGMPLHDPAPLRSIERSSEKQILNDVTYDQHTKLYTPKISLPSSHSLDISDVSFDEINMSNGSYGGLEKPTLNTPSHSEKSFIQQRVERLYGPGALAQGFFFKRTSSNHMSCSKENSKKCINIDNSSNMTANNEEFLKNLPVLRHLRPEFRAQLPVISPRRPIEGTKDVMKPLRRLSIAPRKTDVELPIPARVNGFSTEDESLKLKTSVTNIPDQQLAAPEVVLPVIELVVNPTPTTESKNAIVEEKDGNYFTKLSKAEVERLFSLAASAEAELVHVEALSEDAAGKLRSAAGKARLLATQKMQQFEGLCQKNISQNPGEAFPTTNEDLAGFWDMVMLQVVQVNNLFEHISKLRCSQWQEEVPEKELTANQNNINMKRRTVLPLKSKSINREINQKVREAREQARRQMMEEQRKAMRSQNETQQPVEIFTSKT